MASRILFLLSTMLVLYPFCLFWHEFLHTVIARLRGWAHEITFTPFGPLQGSRSFAQARVWFPIDPTKAQLFWFATAPRLFALVALPLTAWSAVELPLPSTLRWILAALYCCWLIDFVFNSLLIFEPESEIIDSWTTFRAVEGWCDVHFFEGLTLISCGVATTLGAWVMTSLARTAVPW